MNIEAIYSKAENGVVTIITESGRGTGFLINQNGYILTNHHVISDVHCPGGIRVHFPDGSVYDVRNIIDYIHYLGSEDIALLKIDPVRNKTVLPILETGETNTGSEIAIIGSPLGYEFTVVEGIVSSLQPTRDQTNFIQISAPINPGNSGSPVLNRNGYVVGIVVSRIESTRNRRHVAGIGFASNSYAIRYLLTRNNVSFRTTPLISDIELKQYEKPTEEEKEMMQAARQADIKRQRQLDSLKYEREMLRIQEEIRREQEQRERERVQDSLQAIERERERKVEQAIKEQRKADSLERIRKSRPRRISFRIGLGAHHYYSHLNSFADYFDGDKLGVVGNFSLAYRYKIKKAGENERGSSFGIHGFYGFHTEHAAYKAVHVNDLEVTGSDLDEYHSFWEIEAGWLLREWLRLSGGMGNQALHYSNQTLSLNYHTTSLGIIIRFGRAEVDINATALFNGFYNDPAVRANVTLNLHFMAGRW